MATAKKGASGRSPGKGGAAKSGDRQTSKTYATKLLDDARVIIAAGASTQRPGPTLELRRKGKWAAVSALELAKHVATRLTRDIPTPVRRAASLLGQLSTRLAPLELPDLSALKALAIPQLGSMDPKLVLAALNGSTGKVAAATASAEADEIAVLARVTDPDAFEAIAGVTAGARIGVRDDGSHLLTARIEVDRIAQIRAAPGVVSLKASVPLQPALSATTSTMRVRGDLMPADVEPRGGAGVVVGIIDVGCDFAHRNFRKADGSTRLLALWNQAGAARPDSPYDYGRLYLAKDIDAALAQKDPYAALGYPKLPNPQYAKGIHGTHVMDIAAGNGLGSGVPGVAPEADLIFVDSAVKELKLSGAAGVGSAYGDSVQMVEAIKFVLDTAGDRPCAINISLGTNGGPHDGSSLVEQSIDTLLRAAHNRAIVIAASNSQADGIHTMGQVPAGGTLDVSWAVAEYGAEVEFWYPGEQRLEVTLIAPDGTELLHVQPGSSEALGSEGNPAVFVSSRIGDPNNGDNQINIGLAPGMPDGAWIVRLRSLSATPTPFHAWIERFDPAQSRFGSPVASHSLGSISTGHEAVVVGSYDAHKNTFPISYFSSAGPTRDGRQKPELSAPGHNVMAARSLTGDGIVKMSGTSMATPAVTGLVALMLAEAARTGARLAIGDIRAKLMNAAEQQPPAVEAKTWHPQYGFGRVCASAI